MSVFPAVTRLYVWNATLLHFLTTSPDFRAEFCLLTFPLPSIFPCVTSRCAFLPTSLFAPYYERLGQARIVLFSKALHFPTILTGTLLWHAWRKKKNLLLALYATYFQWMSTLCVCCQTKYSFLTFDIINFTFLILDTADCTKVLPILPILTLPSSLTAVECSREQKRSSRFGRIILPAKTLRLQFVQFS